MFVYNEKCVVNKDFRLQELFKAIKADKTIKDSAKNIISIKLSYVISPSKLNLEPSKAVKEIYIIDVTVDSKQLKMSFIEALNNAHITLNAIHAEVILSNQLRSAKNMSKRNTMKQSGIS